MFSKRPRPLQKRRGRFFCPAGAPGDTVLGGGTDWAKEGGIGTLLHSKSTKCLSPATLCIKLCVVIVNFLDGLQTICSFFFIDREGVGAYNVTHTLTNAGMWNFTVRRGVFHRGALLGAAKF